MADKMKSPIFKTSSNDFVHHIMMLWDLILELCMIYQAIFYNKEVIKSF